MSKNIEKQYLKLLKDILENGVEKQDRTGTGTISVFGRQIRHNMSKGFPLLTTKKMYWKGIVTELLWFLRGDTNIKYLVDNDCHIWDGDAYQAYLKGIKKVDPITGNFIHLKYPEEILSKEEFINKIKTDDEFAKKWGELGPVYGAQWRSWDTWFTDSSNPVLKHKKEIDQIANSIHLLKTDPDSRRNRVSAWNVGELDQMTLPPCHTDFQFFTRVLSLEERKRIFYSTTNIKHVKAPTNHSYYDEHNIPTRAISLMWNQRSVDTFLGLPFNIASYGLLLEIIAKEVNMVPDELIGNLGDVHLYKNHIEQVKEQLAEIPWEERREMLTDPSDIREFGNISPFTDKMIHSWLDYKNIPNSRRMPYPPYLDYF
jgi:thymidylate synthase